MIFYKCTCNQFANISLYDETAANNRLIGLNRAHTLYIYTIHLYTSIDFVWVFGYILLLFVWLFANILRMLAFRAGVVEAIW